MRFVLSVVFGGLTTWLTATRMQIGYREPFEWVTENIGTSVLNFLANLEVITRSQLLWLLRRDADMYIGFAVVGLVVILIIYLIWSLLARALVSKPRLPAPREMPVRASVPEGHGSKERVRFSGGSGSGRPYQGDLHHSGGPKGGGTSSI